MSIEKFYSIKAEDGVTQAIILPALGALCSSLCLPTADHDSKEFLYQNDSASSSKLMHKKRGLSVCFPICGQIQRQAKLGFYYYDGALYELPKDGFFWQLEWQVQHHQENQLELLLQDSQETLALFPFQFAAELDFIVQPGKLLCRFTVTNRGEVAMPYSAGFNCYLQIPATLAEQEKLVLNYLPWKHYRYDGETGDMLYDDIMINPPLALTNLPPNDVLTQLYEDRHIGMYFPGEGSLYMQAEGAGGKDMFPFLQFESAAMEPYIGIHSWMSYPNALNSVNGVRWLAPGASEQGLLSISYESPK